MSTLDRLIPINAPSDADVSLGFIPLIDSAPFVIAKEKGFFEKEGVNVVLSKEASWASIRDKVAFNLLQGAHMLASMPLASGLGVGSAKVNIQTSFTVSQNGNGITVSNELYQLMSTETNNSNEIRNGKALKSVMAKKGKNEKPLKFAMVYPYSSHHYQLRDWLSRANIDPDKDLELIVVPPTKMIDFLKNSAIDGYCVGEPWNSLAVEQGIGHMIVTGYEIWGNTPEKVLGVNQNWANANSEQHDALIRALNTACEWVDDAANLEELLSVLSHPDYLNCPAEQLRYGFSAIKPSGQFDWPMEAYQKFSSDKINRPNTDYALWLLGQMNRWGQLPSVSSLLDFAINTFDDRVYCRALNINQPCKPYSLTGLLSESDWLKGVAEDKIRIHPDGIEFGFDYL
jgi:two-component system, oxyanion-binding sensor